MVMQSFGGFPHNVFLEFLLLLKHAYPPGSLIDPDLFLLRSRLHCFLSLKRPRGSKEIRNTLCDGTGAAAGELVPPTATK
jgi:hypothetical protein